MKHCGDVLTIQVGRPRRYRPDDARDAAERSWETSFFREPSPERRWLYVSHLDGNTQADTRNHGTLDQAVLLYAAAHYPRWRKELDRPEIGPGGFGENLTVDGLTEKDACVGDTYAVGGAHIQVTGPRYPCVKIGRRWGIPALTGLVAATGRTGWYCRVTQEGWVEPGLPIALVARPFPEITVALVNEFGHGRNRDVAAAHALAACPLLPAWWRRLVVLRASGSE